MDRSRVPPPKVDLPSSAYLQKRKLPDFGQVENVTCWARGKGFEGTLHISAHHLIFRYNPSKQQEPQTGLQDAYREIWITYPMINFCNYRPSPPASHQPPSIRIRCRDFSYLAFHFQNDKEARAVYESFKACTCKLTSLEQLLAFSYQGVPAEKKFNGWGFYDARKEFGRMGISAKSSDKGWRITNINQDYTYSPTYPSTLVVPSTISDNVLNYAKSYRSKARLPVLTYLHPVNNASITRSSQPMVGVRGNRSPQDERLILAIWSTSKATRPTSTYLLESSVDSPSLDSSTEVSTKSTIDSQPNLLDEPDLKGINDSAVLDSAELPRIYGAQQRNLIVDARPTVNAYAMQAVGMGSENMEHYKGAEKEYFGIDNIHVMRKCLNQIIDTLKDSDFTNLKPNPEQLAKCNWLKHIALLVDGAARITTRVGILHSHVLIHCSDGWDRTSQLSSLAQICLDPYYRTLDGFMTLVAKDWLSFGHMFRYRTGHLSSEKWFEVENERIADNRSSLNGTQTGSGSGNAFENALSKAQGFFKKRGEESEDSDSDGEAGSRASSRVREKSVYATKEKETSPIFHQFLDATYQIMHQFPTRFEFNQRFLKRLLYHVYSCQYGTFLFDNERERAEWKASERTKSVWDHFFAERQKYVNKDYDPVVDDLIAGKERLLLPKKEQVRWFAEMFGRTDAEMNGQIPDAPQMLGPEINQPVVTGVETAHHATGVGTTRQPQPSSTTRTAAQGQDVLAGGLARMGIGIGSPTSGRTKSPRSAREKMEVEMQ